MLLTPVCQERAATAAPRSLRAAIRVDERAVVPAGYGQLLGNLEERIRAAQVRMD
jgi:hypothetical protein